MKFKICLMSAYVWASMLAVTGAAIAATHTCKTLSMSECNSIGTIGNTNTCQNASQVCYQEVSSAGAASVPHIYYSCTTCPAGYTKKTVDISVCSHVSPVPTITECCAPCNNCVSDTQWSSYDTTREVKVTRTCSCGTCNAKNTYRCKAGYYGSGSSILNCKSCPGDSVAISYGNSDAGSESITKCFVNNGSNDTGSYVYKQPCYYESDPLIINPDLPKLEL